TASQASPCPPSGCGSEACSGRPETGGLEICGAWGRALYPLWPAAGVSVPRGLGALVVLTLGRAGRLPGLASGHLALTLRTFGGVRGAAGHLAGGSLAL